MKGEVNIFIKIFPVINPVRFINIEMKKIFFDKKKQKILIICSSLDRMLTKIAVHRWHFLHQNSYKSYRLGVFHVFNKLLRYIFIFSQLINRTH